MNILHITSRKAWIDATRTGRYAPPSLEMEGFIHCSTFTQALPVAEKFYKGQRGLVLLVIDPARLTADLKWEPPSDGKPPEGIPEGDAFPHIYGPLNLDAVIRALDFEADQNGDFSLPLSLITDHR
jgi:uncharacterized protein (DUF952 family)